MVWEGKLLDLGRDASPVSSELGVSEVWLQNRRIFIGTVRDITSRKAVENELLKNNEKLGFLAAIIETTDQAVIGISLDGFIISGNKGAELGFWIWSG